MRSKSYANVVRAVSETPWAILESTLAVIVELVGMRLEGQELSDEEIRERVGAAQAATRPPARSGSVAIVPLYGVLVPKATMFSDVSGATSMQRFMANVNQALDDPEVGSVLIDIDSPGGMVELITEAAAVVRAGRDQKRITVAIHPLAASGAYWIASQASEIVITPSGQAGSIGVFSAHEDISKLQEKLGVKTTLISAGKYKTEGNPYEPLGEEAEAAIKERVDEYYSLFVNDVAKGRGVEVSAVRAGFGEGRIVTARRALKAGMVDRVDTFDNTLARLAKGAPRRSSGRAEAELIGPLIDPAHWEAAGGDAAAAHAQHYIRTMFGSEHEPYAAHGERVLADVEAFVSRSQDRRRARAEARRDLSGADRTRLAAMREQLAGVLPRLDALLAGAMAPEADALAAEAEFLELEARLNGVAV